MVKPESKLLRKLCPSCWRMLDVKPEWVGKKIRCDGSGGCGTVFKIEPVAAELVEPKSKFRAFADGLNHTALKWGFGITAVAGLVFAFCGMAFFEGPYHATMSRLMIGAGIATELLCLMGYGVFVDGLSVWKTIKVIFSHWTKN